MSTISISTPEFREQVQGLPLLRPAVIRQDGSQPRLQRSHSMPNLVQGADGEYAASRLVALEPDEAPGATVRYTPDFTKPGAAQDLDAFVRAFKSPDGTYTESAMSRITGIKADDLPKDKHGLRYTLSSLLGGATASKKGANRVTSQDLKAAAGFADFWRDGSPNGKLTPEKRLAVQEGFLRRGDAAQERNSRPALPSSLSQLGLDFDPELQALLTPEDNPFKRFVAPPTDEAIEESLDAGILSSATAQYLHESAERIKPVVGQEMETVFAKQNEALRDRQNQEGFQEYRAYVGRVGQHLS